MDVKRAIAAAIASLDDDARLVAAFERALLDQLARAVVDDDPALLAKVTAALTASRSR